MDTDKPQRIYPLKKAGDMEWIKHILCSLD